MFNQVQAEITELIGDAVFVRNLSLTLVAAVIIFSGLAQLQSRNSSLGEKLAIANNSNSSSMKIIVRRK